MKAENYPQAYCVRCKRMTETLAKETVILQNKRRALTGYCPECSCKVYKFMPKRNQNDLTVFRQQMIPPTSRTHYSSPNVFLDGTITNIYNDRPKSRGLLDLNFVLISIIAFLGGLIVMATFR